jgi:sugar lactone lactonase YvrE
MGQATDLVAVSADFAPLLKDRRFAPTQQALALNARSVSVGRTYLTLPDAGLLAEDLDYAPRRGLFFITGVRGHKLITLDRKGGASDFISAPDGWPFLAVRVDEARGRVWVTEVALRGLVFSPAGDWGRSALLCYDLASRRLLRRIEGPKDSNLGDMLLTDAGEVIVSDGDGGGVYRAGAADRALQRLDHGDFISPQTPARHPDGRYIFVPDYLRGIAVLELATGGVRWLPMEQRYALNGIDGLYLDGDALLAVQNGTSPARVSVFRLDASRSAVRREQLLARAVQGLDPTHGVVVDDDFYYLSNSGWDAVDDKGNLKSGVSLTPARLVRVPLPALQSRKRSS